MVPDGFRWSRGTRAWLSHSISDLAVIYGTLMNEGAKWRGLTFEPTTVIELRQVTESLHTNPVKIDFDQDSTQHAKLWDRHSAFFRTLPVGGGLDSLTQ